MPRQELEQLGTTLNNRFFLAVVKSLKKFVELCKKFVKVVDNGENI